MGKSKTSKSNRSRRRRTERERIRRSIFNLSAQPVLPSRRFNRLGSIRSLMMERTYGDPYATRTFIKDVANMVPDFRGLFDEFLQHPIDEESFITGFQGMNNRGFPIYLVRTGVSDLDRYLRWVYDDIGTRLRLGLREPRNFQRLVAEYVHILDEYDFDIGRNADMANRRILEMLLYSYGFHSRVTEEEIDSLLDNASPRDIVDMILTALMVHSRTFNGFLGNNNP